MIFRVACIAVAYFAYVAGITTLEGRAAADAVPPTDPAYAAGRRVWLDHACQTCHSIYGVGGHLGPDLTNVARPGNAGTVRATVANGKGAMPAFALSAEQFDALVAYLEAIDRTGVYPPTSLGDPVFGGMP